MTRSASARLEPLPRLGVCFGLAVHSALPFEFLRSGGGRSVQVVASERMERRGTLIQSWPEIPGKRSPIGLFTDPAGYFVEIGDMYRYFLEFRPEQLRTAASAPPTIHLGGAAFPLTRERLLWTTPAAVAASASGDLVLHASCVEVNGGALLIAGPSGTGKTTTAAAFHREGFRVLADDMSVCRIAPDPTILPGPALLRLTAETAARLSFVDRFDPRSSTKLLLSLPYHARGSGEAVPLKGIVLLQRGRGSTSIMPVAPEEIMRALWPAVFHLPGDTHRARTFQLLANMLGQVPAWRVERETSWHTLPGLVQQLAWSMVP